MTVKESIAMADAVRLTCPLCGHSVAFREVDRHFEACLQEVLCVYCHWWPL